MSERITAENLDQIVKRNKEIRQEIEQCVMSVRTTFNRMQVSSPPQLAIQLLRTYGLIQMPIDNKYLSGAIYIKNEKRIPFINTALPRVNQYFTAWHELYHIIFDASCKDYLIEFDVTLKERKAEYFASKMLLGNLLPYYYELSENIDFKSKIYNCMSVFQTPYKAILIELYEIALQMNNSELMELIRDRFDDNNIDIAECFEELGLDNTLVLPSNVIDVSTLNSKIEESIKDRPELNYHKDNEIFLKKIMKEIKLIMGDKNA